MNTTSRVIVAVCMSFIGVLSGAIWSPLSAQEPGSKVWEEYVASLPKDVNPESGSRLPSIDRSALDDAGKKVFDAVGSNPNTLAGLRGPVGIRLYSPGITRNSGRETSYLRYESTISRKHVELIILVTARAFDAQFEWTHHEPPALKAGLDPAVIDAVRYNKPITGLPEQDAAIIQFGREVFGKTVVKSDTFAKAQKLFGNETLVEIVALFGASANTAVLLHAFDQRLLPGQEPLLPIP